MYLDLCYHFYKPADPVHFFPNFLFRPPPFRKSAVNSQLGFVWNSHGAAQSGQVSCCSIHPTMQWKWKVWVQTPHAREHSSTPPPPSWSPRTWHSMHSSIFRFRQIAQVSCLVSHIHNATAFHFFTVTWTFWDVSSFLFSTLLNCVKSSIAEDPESRSDCLSAMFLFIQKTKNTNSFFF